MNLRLASLLALLVLPAAPLPSLAADAGAVCDQLAGSPDDADLPGPAASKGMFLDGIIPEQAAPACLQAIAEHPQERRYFFEYGRVLRVEGYAGAAISVYQRAAAMGSAAAYLGLGLIYEDGDGVDPDASVAEGYYRQSVDLGSIAGMANLAWLYRNGRVPGKGAADAVPLFQRAVDAGDDWSAIDLGDQYEVGLGVAQDIKRAGALFAEAAGSADPDLSAAANNAMAWLAATYDAGALPEALKYAETALDKVSPSDQGSEAIYMDTRGLILHRLGRDEEALMELLNSVMLDPTEAAAFDRLGDVYLALGQRAEAKRAWETALMLDRPNPAAEPRFDPAVIQKKIASVN